MNNIQKIHKPKNMKNTALQICYIWKIVITSLNKFVIFVKL